MAGFKPNKKGVVTGTARADKITWMTSKDWAKAITVNAGNGNDVINFRKSKYKNRLNGQNGNDTIYGGTNADTINGGNGNDKLYGYNGNDVIYGGAGNDQIWGGNGNDRLNANSGNNFLFGENGNDVIYGGTGNDFLSGGAGNDTIYGTAGLNTITGDDGDDTLYGGSGNDYLGGGAGNDIIYSQAGNNNIDGGDGNDLIFLASGNESVNAGTGVNYIYISKNGGTDSIDSGNGYDTLVFSDEKSAANTSLRFSGDDLVISNKSGNTVILRDYANGHSVKTLQFQNYSVAIDKLLPRHTITPAAAGTVDGTAMDDVFNINATGTSTLNPGAGNDIVNLSGGSQDVRINLNVGEGDLAINNMSAGLYSLRFIDNDELLLREAYGQSYIAGTRLGNSLELNLTSGQNIRIDNFFNLAENVRNKITYRTPEDSPYSNHTLHGLIRTGTISLGANENFDDNSSYNYIVAEDDTNHIIKIQTGNNNTVVSEGNGDDDVYIDYSTPGAKNNIVFLNGSGNKNVYDSGYSTRTYINSKDANAFVDLTNSQGDSMVYSYAGLISVSTKKDGSSNIFIYTADDANSKSSAMIMSKGGDQITTWGNTTISMVDSDDVLEDCKIVNIMETGLTTTVQKIHTLTPGKLNGGDVCFNFEATAGTANEVHGFEYTHYNGDQYVDVYALDANGNRLAGVVRFDTTGGVFDAATTDNLIRFWDYNQNDVFLSSMNRYVDMNHVNNYYSFTGASNGAFTNIHSKTYLDSTGTEDDLYDDFKLTIGNQIISDKGGDDDTLYIRELADAKDVKFFFDIKADGTINSNDLIIVDSESLTKIINRQGKLNSLTVENFFGSGNIEDLRAEDASHTYKLNAGALNNVANSLVADVVAWLTNPAHSYGSVSEAIADTNLGNSARGNLLMAYNNAINNTTFNDYWTQIG